jgi:hypothetical protein
MWGIDVVKMRKTSTIIVSSLVLVFAFSLISGVWGDSFRYEAVGGTIAQPNFITAFVVPALVTAGIFGALVLFAFIRVKSRNS